MGFLLGIIFALASLFFLAMAIYRSFWRYAGPGERQARAEYARISREKPESPEAKLSEAEYVDNFFRSRPGFFKYIVFAILIAVFGIPASCAIQIGLGS